MSESGSLLNTNSRLPVLLRNVLMFLSQRDVLSPCDVKHKLFDFSVPQELVGVV